MSEPRTELERVYDEQIYPLMAKVIAICEEHKMPMLADFSLGFDEDSEEDLKCTTALLSDDFEPPENMLRAFLRCWFSLPEQGGVFTALIKRNRGFRTLQCE